MIFLGLITLSLGANAAPPAGNAELPPLAFHAELLSASPYEIKFTPPAGHHFNLGAPAKVDLANGSASQAGILEKDEKKVTAGFQKVAKIEASCRVNAALYVCNDANTYCRPVKQGFACPALQARK